MRLSLVIASLGRGGAERTASVLASAWAERGNEVTIITLVQDDVPAYTLHPAVRLRQLGVVSGAARNLLHGMMRQFRCVRVLRQAFIASKPDLIIGFMDISNVVALLAARGMHVPIIVNEQTHPAFHYIGWHWQTLRRLVYPRAAALVCPTNSVISWLQRRIRVRGDKIPNPLATVPGCTRRADGIDQKNVARTVVAMGRLSREKGFDLLLEAFSRIAGKHSRWRLKILGEGPLRSQLKTQAEELNLGGRVEFAGAVSDPFPVLMGADLFVFSSRFEGFGNALCEAMGSGLPVISFACPAGPPEIVRHGVDGLLVPAEDVAALAAAMDQLMSNDQERMRLAARAPEVAVRFGLARVLSMWDQLFADLLPGASVAGNSGPETNSMKSSPS
jgi:GalNAc-alpha-(1->4)-GalNAc-alpha-(1->3)-diNAcBac-PP-undecaprenol alpha-1,4-N-acetyl-D-galactosaminyltransferase